MLIIIMGKTNSGKDFVAKYIGERFQIPDLVSYSTRPKRDYEVNGKEHWFITKEEMARIKKEEDLIAYTINDKTQIEYCATAQCMTGDPSIYILNPHGLFWGLEHGKLKNIPYITIYVECDEKLILERGIARGDDEQVLRKRLDSEKNEFNAFRDNKEYDFILYNNGTKETLIKAVEALCSELKLNK